MRRGKKMSLFIKIVNIVLFSLSLVIGLILLLVSIEKEKEVAVYKTKSLTLSKEETMMSKEIVETVESKEMFHEEKEVVEETDPELDYAIKLFETKINNDFKKNFKKPFDYKEGSYCLIDFNLEKQSYKIKECNDGAIYKRAVELAIDEMMPMKRVTYNKVNLKKEDVVITVGIN